ncbi:MAG: aminoglycoside phosphotransferase [Sphingomonadales bacterium 12-68-11]|nr:MAG: aminoglycoside phosphotransferase [Sphingomonadales bacterium 12-68-11]
MNDTLPTGLDDFLAEAGWGGAEVEPLPGDASFRRYFRVRAKERDGAEASAMLMDAPPPHEDPRPFLHVGKWLAEHGLRAPRIYAERAEQGLVLIEDFGADRMRDWLDANPLDEDAVYARAIDALVELHARPPGPFAAYDMATYQREAALFSEWFCPLQGIAVDAEGLRAAWDAVLTPLLPRQDPGVTVLRDYHAENIMLLRPEEPGGGEQGLIDFQDALVGHRAYDLVSLLQDARRDVSPVLERRMLDRYCAQVDAGEDFEADYARLGAQRNAKIVGIFARLWVRDHKSRYLAMIPRVWDYLERDLTHPALAPVADWFAGNIPQEVRDTGGGELQ